MKTAQYRKITRVRHILEISGPVNTRDLDDFVFQVKSEFERIKGRPVKYDDDYTVEATDDGLMAWFETKEKAS